MTTINLKKDFDNVGMGVSIAGGWAEGPSGSIWVAVMASAEGRGRKRDWYVSATHHPKGGDAIRVEFSQKDCFRYEAAQTALDTLLDTLNGLDEVRGRTVH